MKRVFFFFFVAMLTTHLLAQNVKPVKVLLLGTFHFDNPGLDVAKFADANIFSPKRQQEVAAVLEKLKAFRPDKIYVEAPFERQDKLDSSFAKFNAGAAPATASEVQQLGYRLAKDLKLQTVYGIDFNDAAFPFDSLMRSAAAAGQEGFLSNIKKSIDSIQNNFNESLKKYTIQDMLLRENSPTTRAITVGWYFELLRAGKPGNHVGAYLTSEWWRRNMVIYENILKTLTGKEEKVLVIFGSGHTALLHEMMRYNKDLQIVAVSDVL